MIGTAMGLLALVMIPLGFALSWWLVRSLDAKGRQQRDEVADDVIAPARTPHPSTLPAVPLDDAPSHVIAAVAQRVGAPDPDRRRDDLA